MRRCRMPPFRRRLCVVLTALLAFAVLKILFLDSKMEGMDFVHQEEGEYGDGVGDGVGGGEPRLTSRTDGVRKSWEQKVAGVFSLKEDFPPPNYKVHVFYYTWYGNPRHDGRFVHWNHPILPHWNPDMADKYETGLHTPPDDIGASFYPALGPYSSRDPSVIAAHMQQLRTAAAGVLAVSWYPPGMKDDNGDPTEDIVPLILDAAAEYKLKVAFHIEPYRGRNATTMRENVKYIVNKYGDHPAFFRYKLPSGKLLPLFYIYDSYLQTAATWAQLLTAGGSASVRSTAYDGVFVALLVQERHQEQVVAAGFDGVYTYFATNGFTYGSTQANWRSIKSFCDVNNLIFIPSVGPGYSDTSVRPWNGQNTRNRVNGKYYEASLRAALDTGPHVVSVTSFNEWHEGTQIESAVPRRRGQTAYLDYLPYKPTVYLDITRRWAQKFREERRKWRQFGHK